MEPQTLVALRQRMMEHHAKREYVAVKGRTPEQQERIERVSQSNARTQRLIGWLTFFRAPGERGIGDTALRMSQLAWRRSPTIKSLVDGLMKQCACKRLDAVSRLNKEHPYANT